MKSFQADRRQVDGGTDIVTQATSAGALKLAVFDVDWTLLVVTSAESLLVKYLRHRKVLTWGRVLRFVDNTIRTFPQGLVEAFLKNKSYLAGIDVEWLSGNLDEYYHGWLEPHLAESMIDKIHELKAEGTHIVLLSGTLDILTALLCEKLQLNAGIGSTLEIRDGIYTGKMKGIYPIHRGKVRLLSRYLKGREVDWTDSWAFGDSYWDIPLLSLFGHPVAVHPDVALRKEAVRRGWPVEKRRIETGNPLLRVWIESVYRRSL